MSFMLIELQTAMELARQAGAILFEYFQKDSPVRWKSAGDPVTAADTMANTFLVSEIRKRFPKDGVLSEEELDDRARLDKSRVWIIDPMDGTREFVAGIGEFAVQIGLIVEGNPSMGVVYQPTEGRMFYGTVGEGAFVEQGGVTMPLQVEPKTDASDIVAAVSRSYDSARYQSIRRELGIRRIIQSGGAGIKIGLICLGQAHLYLHSGPETNLWDICAPEVILREAGGRITDMFNSPLKYNVEGTRNLQGVIASNGAIHEQVVKAARQFLQSNPD